VRKGGGRARFVGFPKRYLSDFVVSLDNLMALILAIIYCNLWPYGDIILVRKPNPSSPLTSKTQGLAANHPQALDVSPVTISVAGGKNC
jgi:hypothetical protein